jgi:hypothetical protein
MSRTLSVPANDHRLFGATIFFAVAAVALVAVAGYCAWIKLPVLSTHAAAASVILCRRVCSMLQG